MRRVAIVVVALTTILAACGSGGSPPKQSGSGDGEKAHLVLIGERSPELTVLRFEITSGACGAQRPKLGQVDVDEDDAAVTVTASVIVPPATSGNCAAMAIVIPVTVALERGLGNRRILDGSCSPPADVVSRGEEREPCSATAQQEAEEGAVGRWERFNAGPLATRGEPRAVWTGKEMIVVGGLAIEQYGAFADGAAYDPETKQWRRIARRPDPGRIMGVAWTGTEIFALGRKEGTGIGEMGSAHLYNPTTDQWRAASAPPRGFEAPDAWWTGKEVVVWQLGSGALYNPVADTWRDIPSADGAEAAGRAQWLDTAGVLAVQSAVTPENGGPLRDALLLFDPVKNQWRKAAAPPGPIQQFTLLYAAWVGTDELFKSDETGGVLFAYDPRGDKWRRIEAPETNIDQGTAYFAGVSIGGGRGVVRIGDSHRPLLLFDADSGKWSHSAAPDGKFPAPDSLLVWTGKDVLVWGRPMDATSSDPNAAWKWSPP
ncbi:MAG: hypothetical protein QOI61_732 [Actinomycetota bacterium]